MKNSSKLAAAVLLAAAAFSGLPAAGQSMSAPIVVKSSPAIDAKNAAKGNWLHAEVIHVDSNSMVVREQGNGMMVHTFTYTPQVQAQIQRILNGGGYQYGDKIKVLYQQGQTVALKVRGKPSKAL
jgi:hypothetical protein